MASDGGRRHRATPTFEPFDVAQRRHVDRRQRVGAETLELRGIVDAVDQKRYAAALEAIRDSRTSSNHA